MSDKVRVALVGCGNIGSGGHAPAYARVPGAELVVACDLLPGRAEAVARATGAEPCGSFQEVVARDDVDAVDLCVPTDRHAPLAVEALQAGKHVLCEKPIARTLEEADAMIAAAREAGRVLMVGHVRRFDHRYVAVKGALRAGDVGRPIYIRRAERQWLPVPADVWYWRPEAGGGVIVDIGVHIADMFRWLLEDEPVSVYAVGRQVRQAAREANSFDHALMTFRFAGGAIAVAEASWAYQPSFGRGLYAALDIVGTAGTLHDSDQQANPMLVYDATQGPQLPHYFRFMSTTEHAFQAEIAHFVACVRGEHPPAISPHDARRALEMALAAQRSAETGSVVPL